ncbi:hypothetical protein [Calycomorphotria hydatis]|nr:hypothetical protein [Calycomorphotria hydatis]
MPKHYYRLLFSASHIERWKQKKFSSFHPHGPPSEWLAASQRKSWDKTEYPLVTNNGVYLESARDEYVKWCENHADQIQEMEWDKLEDDFKWKISELKGVCAFDNPAGAYWYGDHDEAAPNDADRFVVFTGNEVFRLKSEANGGVQALVIKQLGKIMTRHEFIAKHCENEIPARPEGIPETPPELPGLSENWYEPDDNSGEIPHVR